jgi:hypothetical protein
VTVAAQSNGHEEATSNQSSALMRGRPPLIGAEVKRIPLGASMSTKDSRGRLMRANGKSGHLARHRGPQVSKRKRMSAIVFIGEYGARTRSAAGGRPHRMAVGLHSTLKEG